METETAELKNEISVPPPSNGHDKTPAQAKIDAIASLTMSAYAKASQLSMTPEEVEKLKSDFPDDSFRPGAAGKENLIYIEHASLRDRLNDVFGPGQWSIVPRSRWTEEFKTSTGKDAVRVYVEAMLLIRGCFVAEAIGDMDYHPGNAMTNFGDAVEGAKSSCLRRCAKELGIGLQAWKKDWTEGWWKRRIDKAKKGAQAPKQTAQEPQGQPQNNQRQFTLNLLEAAALNGTASLEKAWKMITKEQRQDCAGDLKGLKEKAAQAPAYTGKE